MDVNLTKISNMSNNTVDSNWVSVARFAIEGVTQGIVGIFGLFGKSNKPFLEQLVSVVQNKITFLMKKF